MNRSNEIWKDVIGWEGHYQVSSLGQIRSVDKITKSRPAKGRIRKPSLQNGGYLTVSLYVTNKEKYKLIHRLVAEAFIPNIENKKFVNHKNGIKTDNRVENLEWCTFSENISHSYRIGTRIVTKKMIDRIIAFNKNRAKNKFGSN